MLPLAVNEVNVPTDVIFGCAAVVTVPAVVAAPDRVPTKFVEVTLDKPATVVTVLPNVSVVLPNVTLAFASLACASVPVEMLLAFNAVSAEPLPLTLVNTPDVALMFPAATFPVTFKLVSVPTDVILGCAAVVTVSAVVALVTEIA